MSNKINIPVGNYKINVVPTPQERLEWHRRQVTHYETMLSAAKTRGVTAAAYNGIVRHKAAITTLEIELGLFQSRQIIRA